MVSTPVQYAHDTAWRLAILERRTPAMEPKNPSPPPRPGRKPIDPRTRQLAREIKERLKSRGMTQGQLARASGVDASLLSQFLGGRAGLSFDAVFNILQVLNLALVVRGPEEGALSLVGAVTARGEVTFYGGIMSPQLPATLQVEAALFGRCAPGDKLVMEQPATFEPGKTVLVRHADGRLVVYEARVRGDLRILGAPTGDEVLYDEKIHELVANIVERRERW